MRAVLSRYLLASNFDYNESSRVGRTSPKEAQEQTQSQSMPDSLARW